VAKATLGNENIDALIAAAQDALRRGDLSQTISHYQAVLAVDPEHGLANYWLGVLTLKASMPKDAIPLLSTAAAKLPELPDVHIDLGLAWLALADRPRAENCFQAARAAAPTYAAAQLTLASDFERDGKLVEAVEACQRGLVVFPRDADLLRKLADLHSQRGQWSEALAAWKALLEIRPDCPATHFAFGEKCYEAGAFDFAASAFQRVRELRPDSLNALLNLGLTLLKLGDPWRALECFQRATEISPAQSGIYKCRGDAQRDLGNWPQANAAWQKAVELDPENADAWQNLGLGLERQERLEEALACHRRVVQLRPGDATAHRYLGMILQDVGTFKAASDCYEQSLRLDPNDAESHWQKFSLLAARGEFPQAWAEHEWRWELKKRDTPRREFKQPKWTGDDLAGRRVLLYAEQGFGDTIQAVRYVPRVKARGGSVLLWCPPDLVSLLRTLPGAGDVFSDLTPEKSFDCHLALMSLPLIFGTTLASIPNAVPYLRAPRDSDFVLPQSSGRAPRVGLVWCGSRSQPHDRRPVPFENLRPLLEIEGAEFYSLQKGTDLSNQQTPPPRQVFDLAPQLTDFGATAAAIEQMDLVITIDTAVAHLAGALGKPVWVLLSFAPDWRWLLEREDSPWYPTMRLFRQTTPGRWDDVIRRVCLEFLNWLATYQQPSVWRPWLAEGLAHHHAGRLAEAESSYQRVLAVAPDQAEALRFLGVIFRQRGDLARAREFLEKALAVQPQDAHAHHDLGLARFESGQFEQAAAAYRKAIEILPGFPEAHYHLGNACYALQQSEDAAASYRRALEHQPDLAEAHYNLGLLAQEKGELESAAQHYRRTTELNPSHLDALLNLGLVLKDSGKVDVAEACLEQLLGRDPKHPKARINLAALWAGREELEKADEMCREVLRDFPALAEAWLNLGVIRQSLGDPAEAIQDFRRALDLLPDYADAQYNQGIAQLLTGDFAAGWKNYEARWRTEIPIFKPRGFSEPLWPGEDLEGRRVLVHAEQGLGDAIQFVRYLPLLAERGAEIFLECPAPLVRLLATSQGVARVISRGEPWPAIDFQIPLLSLPHRLGTTLGNIPNQVPYIRVPDGTALKLARSASANLSVGLAWAGNPLHGKDRSRSIALRQFSTLLSLPNVACYSLQAGPANRELSEVKSARPIVNLEPQLTDFAATASAIQQLDLVISVDTAVAHLAGALGKPVWVLIPFAPDWRWLLGREDSPWYPTMRLFRQRQHGDWSSVIERIKATLQTEARRA
jgi:tetratricopeptide (TPR) repeat protein